MNNAIKFSLAVSLLAASAFLPLWRMELIAPQYPKGLVMEAYGYKFTDSNPSDSYDEVREINALNHYIGMKTLKEVTEMKLFIPGLVALIAATVFVSTVDYARKWLRLIVIAGFWTFPLFFIASLPAVFLLCIDLFRLLIEPPIQDICQAERLPAVADFPY